LLMKCPNQAFDDEMMHDRQYAFVIDWLLWSVLGRALLVWTGLREYVSAHFDGIGYWAATLAGLIGWRLVLLCKDGVKGYSPGKWLFRLRVVRLLDGSPIGVKDSLKRNLVLVVPGVGELLLWLHLRTRAEPSWGRAGTTLVRIASSLGSARGIKDEVS